MPPNRADYVVRIDGALARPYSRPRLENFAASSFITDVVVGRVTSTNTYVVEPGAEVYTGVTIKVDAARSADRGSLITIRETGGEVRVSELRHVLDGHLPETITDTRSDSTVDFRINGQPHTSVGQKVLFFIGGRPSDPGGQFAAARMSYSTDAQRFEWMGKPFNEEWASGLDRSAVQAILGSTD